MLADNIALNLRRAAANGRRETVQITALPNAIIMGAVIADIISRPRALQANGKGIEALIKISARQFRTKRQRHGSVLRQRLNFIAAAVQAQSPRFRHQRDKFFLHSRIFNRRSAVQLGLAGQPQNIGRVGHHHHMPPGLAGARAAFIFQRLHGNQPAFALIAHQAICRNTRIGEKGLRKAIFAGQLFNRHSLDAAIFHRREEEAQTLIFILSVRIGARQQNHIIGVIALCRPNFGAVDNVLIAIFDGAGLGIAQIRAVFGLRKTLTPNRLCRQNAFNIFLLFVFRAAVN